MVTYNEPCHRTRRTAWGVYNRKPLAVLGDGRRSGLEEIVLVLSRRLTRLSCMV